MLARIGIFFFIVGAFLLLLFGASIGTGQVVIQWFLLGILFFVFGGYLWNRNWEKPSSQRFRTIRKLMSRGDKRE